MGRPKINRKHWRCWGLFYYNPEDPSLFVDKPFGIGQTLNYANPTAWWLSLFIIGFPLAVLSLIFLKY